VPDGCWPSVTGFTPSVFSRSVSCWAMSFHIHSPGPAPLSIVGASSWSTSITSSGSPVGAFTFEPRRTYTFGSERSMISSFWVRRLLRIRCGPMPGSTNARPQKRPATGQ
jgi:hypothetical protein